VLRAASNDVADVDPIIGWPLIQHLVTSVMLSSASGRRPSRERSHPVSGASWFTNAPGPVGCGPRR